MIRGKSIEPALAALLVALSLAGLAGCAGKSARALSPVRLEAIAHNKRGIQEEALGRRELALTEFSEALRLQSSIENHQGMIVSLINLARTQRMMGNLPAARGAIERAAALTQGASELAGELYFEKAKILLAAGELDSARQWALRAQAEEKGGELGRRANLVAAILLRQGMPEQAAEQAEKALKLNKGEALAGEAANSLRLLGEIHLLQGMSDRAADCYREALSLDKELSFGGKIAADLRGLGGAQLKKSDLPGAIGFYRRALEVSLSRGDAGPASADMVKLAELLRASGDPDAADKLDAERKKLPVK